MTSKKCNHDLCNIVGQPSIVTTSPLFGTQAKPSAQEGLAAKATVGAVHDTPVQVNGMMPVRTPHNLCGYYIYIYMYTDQH